MKINSALVNFAQIKSFISRALGFSFFFSKALYFLLTFLSIDTENAKARGHFGGSVIW